MIYVRRHAAEVPRSARSTAVGRAKRKDLIFLRSVSNNLKQLLVFLKQLTIYARKDGNLPFRRSTTGRNWHAYALAAARRSAAVSMSITSQIAFK